MQLTQAVPSARVVTADPLGHQPLGGRRRGLDEQRVEARDQRVLVVGIEVLEADDAPVAHLGEDAHADLRRRSLERAGQDLAARHQGPAVGRDHLDTHAVVREQIGPSAQRGDEIVSRPEVAPRAHRAAIHVLEIVGVHLLQRLPVALVVRPHEPAHEALHRRGRPLAPDLLEARQDRRLVVGVERLEADEAPVAHDDDLLA